MGGYHRFAKAGSPEKCPFKVGVRIAQRAMVHEASGFEHRSRGQGLKKKELEILKKRLHPK
jgi:hypothetical protein